MALVVADRVQETTSTTGTGTLTLSGAVSGYQSFAAIGNANTTYYAISSGANWEVGIGTYTSVGTTLSRDTVISSSAGGTTKISVAAGASVFSTYPASIATPIDITGYTTTATAAGTTVLTVSSTFNQFFTGTTTQTVTLPVTSTLSLGWSYWITNNSTGNVTVNSSGGNLVYTVLPQTTVMFTCIDITVTTAAGWDAGVMEFGTSTGTGSVVLATSPTLTTPNIGTPSAGNLSNCTVDGTNSVGYKKVPDVGSKNTAYTLQTADVGKYVQVTTGGSIVVPDATFADGDVISVFNNTTGSITITLNITTAYLAGTDADKASLSLATRGVASILFISGTVCVVTGNVS